MDREVFGGNEGGFSHPSGELEGALMQPGDVPRTEADVNDLVENLGYKPDTPVQKGIERFIEWYKEYFKIKQNNITK